MKKIEGCFSLMGIFYRYRVIVKLSKLSVNLVRLDFVCSPGMYTQFQVISLGKSNFKTPEEEYH